jgi:hypothetical protein
MCSDEEQLRVRDSLYIFRVGVVGHRACYIDTSMAG